MEEGFFNMDIIRNVCESKTFDEAKAMVVELIESKKRVVKAENYRKALNMVEKSTSKNSLAISMTNFMFAHPSEGLKTIR